MISEDGGMMHRDLECFAEHLINTKDLNEAITNLNNEIGSYYSKQNIDPKKDGKLFLGNDTRPSAVIIKELFK